MSKLFVDTATDRGTPDARFRRPVASSTAESEPARRELVRRIVESPTFARSERLSTLLTYICDLALKGRESEINEQRIGHEVFERPAGYDSSADGIVRSQASRLRQRLDLYFQHEGADEPVRIVIPRGGYVPVFETQAAASSEPPAVLLLDAVTPAAPVHTPVSAGSASSLRRWFAPALCVVLALLLATLWIYDRHPSISAATPASHHFWSLLFRNSQPTLVVAPDSGLVLYHGASGQDVNLSAYLDGGYRAGPDGANRIGPAVPQKEWLLNLANRRYTSIVDLEMILHLKDRARSLGSDITVRYARDLRPDDFKAGDVILLGSREADPWDELFHPGINFILEDDYMGDFSVRNRNPRPGEPSRWDSKSDDPQHRVYGLVAFLPNLGGNGNALLLEGTGMSGTQAAMDFVSDDTLLLPFIQKIRLSDGTLPHFELLLETHNMGASAVRSQILAWRTMK
ncbi:hypothetical protein [Silvibacterium acidisoli]|uniref:hypothetical protein n=1 Tax=Acidobacteriaceae bacterium ZG23-2 TaxID=2883246 RepID=UPI00406BFE31